jgi:hypothetical protein
VIFRRGTALLERRATLASSNWAKLAAPERARSRPGRDGDTRLHAGQREFDSGMRSAWNKK